MAAKPKVPDYRDAVIFSAPEKIKTAEDVSVRKKNANTNKKRKKRHLSESRPREMDFEISNQFSRDGGTKEYHVETILGVGSQGRVYLVRSTKNNQYYAMKVFSKNKVLPNPKTTRSILTEHRFLSTTDHPFITKLYHSFQSYERLFMVMEYCPGGELFTMIRKQPNGRLNENQVNFYAAEVVLVLEYIHSRGYIYRDLKPENILLHKDGHVRIADFGLSKQSDFPQPQLHVVPKKNKYRNPFSKKKFNIELQQGEVLRTSSLVGSVHYLAPEVVSGDSYDEMADWWAFGVLLYDMFFGFPPFYGDNNREILHRIAECDYCFPDDISISSNLKSLIKGLLKYDPKKRIGSKCGASDIKKHPFFSNIHWGLVRNRTPPIIPFISDPADTSNFEVYSDDEDETEFNFFSDLPEDPNAISWSDQQKFEEFNFRRDAVEVGKNKLRHVKSEKSLTKLRKDKKKIAQSVSDVTAAAVSKILEAKSEPIVEVALDLEPKQEAPTPELPNLEDLPPASPNPLKYSFREKPAKQKSQRKSSPTRTNE